MAQDTHPGGESRHGDSARLPGLLKEHIPGFWDAPEVSSSVQACCVLGWFGLVSVIGRGLRFPQLGRLWGSVGVEWALYP